MYSNRRRSLVRGPRALATFVASSLLASASFAEALTWNVPGDASNTCTMAVPSCDTVAGAVAAASAGDTVQLSTGVFPASGVDVDKSLTIAGILSFTMVEGDGTQPVFRVTADDVTFQNLTVTDGTDGVRIEKPGSSVSRTAFSQVVFFSNSSDGLEISGTTTANDTTVTGCSFDTNTGSGIRMASTSTVSGLEVTDSLFRTNRLGIYQANDASTSTLTGLTVTGTTFEDNGASGGDAAIYAEEIRDSTISGNTFTDNYRGILVFKGYSTSGAPLENLEVSGNTFTGQSTQSIEIIPQAVAAGPGIVVSGNTITQDVSLLTTNFGLIDLRLRSSLTHEPIEVSGNTVELTGTFSGPATAAYAVMIRGNGPVAVTGNILDGGGTGGSATNPATSGVFLRSTDSSANFAQIPATASFDITCNRILGFENGVAVYSPVAASPGGLLGGTTVNVEGNTIAGNASAGVLTAAAAPTIDAEGNYWGCAAGPGNPGCDSVTGDVDADPVSADQPACVACADDLDCDDGLACNGAETCDDGTLVCVAGTPVDCDDANDCTDDACEEPSGACANDPVANGTLCDDGVACSTDDTCESGVCFGDADDDMSGTCDADETLFVVSAALKAQKDANGKGKAGARGGFATTPPGDVLDASSNISIRVEDAMAVGEEHVFAPADCVSKSGGAKISCRSTDKAAKLQFKADKIFPAAWSFKFKKKDLAIDGPFAAPLSVELGYGAGPVSRISDIATCKSKSTLTKCK